MFRFHTVCLLLVSTLQAQQVAFAEPLTVACSPWKPYYYHEDGVIKGSAYEIAKAVTERAGIEAEFTVQPWKRVYESGLNKADYMIACIGRVPQREALFHWVGPVTKTTYYNFYKLKKANFSIESHKDVLNHQVGVMRGSLTQGFMEDLSHPKLQVTANSAQLVKMLEKGRIDLLLEASNVIEHESKLADIDPNIFELALVGYEISINLSLGKKTSESRVQKIKEAYKALAAEGKINLP